MASNLYITTADFLKWQRSTSSDANDDAVIQQIIEQTSRFIDQITGRRFYPSIEEHKFDLPGASYSDRDTVYLDDDLLAVITFKNGDGTTISASDYILKSVSNPPYYLLKLRDSSSVTWATDTNGSSEQVLALNGIWGWHNNYKGAWVQVGTLKAAINSSTTSIELNTGQTAASEQIWKIDSEIIQGTVATNILTVNVRGDNGSTAASHLISAPVYRWDVASPVAQACQLMTDHVYKKRFGDSASSVATVTAAGVVLTPSDIPATAKGLLQNLSRLA